MRHAATVRQQTVQPRLPKNLKKSEKKKKGFREKVKEMFEE